MITLHTAAGLLVNPAGHFLLGLRSAHKRVAPQQWDMIGGHLEPGEDARQALDRELREELAIEVVDAHLLGHIDQFELAAGWAMVHHVFAVTAWRGLPVNNCDEHDEIRWFGLDEIARLPNRTPFDIALLRSIRQPDSRMS